MSKCHPNINFGSGYLSKFDQKYIYFLKVKLKYKKLSIMFTTYMTLIIFLMSGNCRSLLVNTSGLSSRSLKYALMQSFVQETL